TPASSRSSRIAASSAVSPGSIWPLGKIHSRGFFFARATSTSARDPFRRTTIAPACAMGDIGSKPYHNARGTMLRVTDAIVLEDHEVEERFVRASGPGGQHVNKVA